MAMTTVLDWLIREYPLAKRQTLKRMVEARRVRVNGRVAWKLSEPLGVEDKVEVSAAQVQTPVRPTASNLSIVFEDQDILVVNKPSGLLTSTVPREPRATLLPRRWPAPAVATCRT